MKLKDVTIDHIRPVSRNGRNGQQNYHPACKECNGRKSNLSIEEWRRQIQKHGAHFELIDGHYFYFELHRAIK
jgi:5-methylcytosine-specific restriction endonuclease McrA